MNPLLRDHVQRVGFDLQLRQSQIEVLVWLNESSASARSEDRFHTRAVRNFVGPAQGLGRRGLVAHVYDEVAARYAPERPPGDLPLRSYYRITRAGELVIELLREAGIYEEHERALFPERFTRTGKRRKLSAA